MATLSIQVKTKNSSDKISTTTVNNVNPEAENLDDNLAYLTYYIASFTNNTFYQADKILRTPITPRTPPTP